MHPAYIHPSSPCLICHQQGDTLKKEKLRRMEEICRKNSILTDNINPCRFTWGLNSHCRYGLSCPSLQQFDNECNQIANRIEHKLAAIAASDSKDYRDILELCRGDFPAVYHQLERIYNENHN